MLPAETNISCVAPLICEGRTTLDAAFGTFQFAIGICFIFFVGVLMLYSVTFVRYSSRIHFRANIFGTGQDIDDSEWFPVLDLGFRDCHRSFLHHWQHHPTQIPSSTQTTPALVGILAALFFLHVPRMADRHYVNWMVLLPRSTLVSPDRKNN